MDREIPLHLCRSKIRLMMYEVGNRDLISTDRGHVIVMARDGASCLLVFLGARAWRLE